MNTFGTIAELTIGELDDDLEFTEGVLSIPLKLTACDDFSIEMSFADEFQTGIRTCDQMALGMTATDER